jgi:hypothetical protein
MIWSQATPPRAGASAQLALRRWCASLSLSSPDPFPRPFGLYVLLAGLGALLLVVLIAQGPRRALRQLFDVPGHAAVLAGSLRRLRRAGRLVAVICGVTVVGWTANQFVAFSNPQATLDLEVLLKSKSVGELGLEQGVLAALTPLRDVCGMGDFVLLVVVAAALVFRLAADRWGGIAGSPGQPPPPVTGWTTLCWGGTWLYALYRLAAMVDPGDLPLGSCVMIEAAIVPLLMALADGLLLAWILAELRNAGLGEGGGPLDVAGALDLVPGATLACVLALPARYLATGTLLSFLHMPSYANGVPLPAYEQLAWSLVTAQGAALVTFGFAGAVAWSRGTMGGSLRGYLRLLSAEGGHLFGVLVMAGLAGGGLTALAYTIILALPAQTWVLLAADSYGHYATLVVGLATLSALVELGERLLPVARLAEPVEAATAVEASTAAVR